MASQYRFGEYAATWPAAFVHEVKCLEGLLGDELVTIHHIGSTSVPGLAAKPIIDLLPLVHDITRIDQYNPIMIAAGYQVWGEYGLPGRRYFNKDANGMRTHNVHVYAFDHPEVTRHLAFCAYLRAHPAACAEYVAVKRLAYAQHPADINAYNHAKDPWIKATEPLALAWYQQQVAGFAPPGKTQTSS